MSAPILCLSSMPDKIDFYQNYWNKKPFVVKKYVPSTIMKKMISADELAGLSLEDDIRSRIVIRGKDKEVWKCNHGPFHENDFAKLGEENWSLLVQKVDRHHEKTGQLLSIFEFAPIWLLDDIMGSYSTTGGGVGPHLDSYHVFLVQGMGVRKWKIAREPLQNADYIENLDLKILKDDFDGDMFEVSVGDVIYIPPMYPHSGTTIKESMTYSIGFLGPSLSEMMVEYGHYIEEHEAINSRYTANGLDTSSAGPLISAKEVDNFRASIINTIKSEDFDVWLKSYFTRRDDDD